MKVVARLASLGSSKTLRGKGGGIRWRGVRAIRIGEVVRAMEAELGVVECLQADDGGCVIRRKHAG